MSDQEYAELMDEREAYEIGLVERIAKYDVDLAKEVASALGLDYLKRKSHAYHDGREV